MSQTFLEDIPEFLEIQRNSFLRILDIGLIQAFEKINPIIPTSQCKYGLLFYPKEYVLILPESTITEAFLQGKTYGCKIYVPAVIYNIENSVNSSRRAGRRFKSLKTLRFTKATSSRFSEETFFGSQESGYKVYPNLAVEMKKSKAISSKGDFSRIMTWECFLTMLLAIQSVSRKNKALAGKWPLDQPRVCEVNNASQLKRKFYPAYNEDGLEVTDQGNCLALKSKTFSKNRENKLWNFISKLSNTFGYEANDSILSKHSLVTKPNLISKLLNFPDQNAYPKPLKPSKQRLKPTLHYLLKKVVDKKKKPSLVLNLKTSQCAALTIKKQGQTLKENFVETKKQVLYETLPKTIRQKSKLGFFQKNPIWLRGRSNNSLIHEAQNRLQLLPFDDLLARGVVPFGHDAQISKGVPCPTDNIGHALQKTGDFFMLSDKKRGSKEWLLPFSKGSLINPRYIKVYSSQQTNMNFHGLQEPMLGENNNLNLSLDSSLASVPSLAKPLSRKEWVCIGVLPLMTPRGHFIINGSHRIIISQMARAPGLYYQTGDKVQATIVPSKGAWLRLSVKASDNGEIKIWVRITPQRKMPYKIFIETYKHLEMSKAILSKGGSKFLNLTYKTLNSKIKHLDKQYAVGVISGQINRTLLNRSSYSLGALGRKRLNERLGINDKKGYLTSKDISLIKDNLLKLLGQKSTDLSADDIDHLENRRVRTCGELLQTEIETGMTRLKKAVGKQLDEYSNPDSSLFNTFKSHAIENRNNNSINSHIYTRQINETNEPSFSLQESLPISSNNPSHQQNLVNLGNTENTVYKTKKINNFFWLKTLNKQNWELYTATPDQTLALFKQKTSGSFWKKNKNLLFLKKKLSALLTLYSSLTVQTHYKGKNQENQQKKIGITLAQARLGTEISSFLVPFKKASCASISSGEAFQASSPWPEAPSLLLCPLGNPLVPKGTGTPFSCNKVSKNNNSPITEWILPDVSFTKKKNVSKMETKNRPNLLSPSKIIGTKAFAGALREFFGSNPLSQYMDQTNPLAEITHKRRLSSLGPGGVDRASAGIAIRGIHPSHYGRICPIETPEGKNAGLVNSMTMWARVNNEGFLETPYFMVKGGSLMSHTNNLIPHWNFLPTKIESQQALKIVSSDLKITQSAFLPSIALPTRDGSERSFGREKRDYVDFCGISPMQNISVATSLIPFLEHDDATRALMGSNMQRQAVPLLKAKEPLIRTGLEGKVVGESGHALQASCSGIISTATRTFIAIDSFEIIKKRIVAVVAKHSLSNQGKNSARYISPYSAKHNTTSFSSKLNLHGHYQKMFANPLPVSTLASPISDNTINGAHSAMLNQGFVPSGQLQGSKRSYPFELSRVEEQGLDALLCAGRSTREAPKRASLSMRAQRQVEHGEVNSWQTKKKYIGNIKKLPFLQKSFLQGNSKYGLDSSLSSFLAPKPISSLFYIINYCFKDFFKGWLSSCWRIGLFDNLLQEQVIALLEQQPQKVNTSFMAFLHAHNVLPPSLLAKAFAFRHLPYSQQGQVEQQGASLSMPIRQGNISFAQRARQVEYQPSKTTINVSRFSNFFNQEKKFSLGSVFNCNSTLKLKSLPCSLSLTRSMAQCIVRSKPSWTVSAGAFYQLQSLEVRKLNSTKSLLGLANNAKHIFARQHLTPFAQEEAFKSPYTVTLFNLAHLTVLALPIKHSNHIKQSKQQVIPKTLWRENSKIKRHRKIHDLQQYARSNQATVCVQRPAVTEGRWVQKGDLIGDCSASKNGVLALGQNIVVAYLPMEGFNFEDAIVVSDRLVHEELYTSIHVQRVEFDMDALVKKHIPRKIKVKKQKSAYKTNNQDWITFNNPHLLQSEKQNLNPLGIINVGSWVGPGDVLVSKVFPVDRKIAPSRHLLAAVYQEKKTKILDTDDTSVRVPKGIHGRVINVKIVGAGKTAPLPLIQSCLALSQRKKDQSTYFSILCEASNPIKSSISRTALKHSSNSESAQRLDKVQTPLLKQPEQCTEVSVCPSYVPFGKEGTTSVQTNFSSVPSSFERQQEQRNPTFSNSNYLTNFLHNKEVGIPFFCLDYEARKIRITKSLIRAGATVFKQHFILDFGTSELVLALHCKHVFCNICYLPCLPGNDFPLVPTEKVSTFSANSTVATRSLSGKLAKQEALQTRISSFANLISSSPGLTANTIFFANLKAKEQATFLAIQGLSFKLINIDSSSITNTSPSLVRRVFFQELINHVTPINQMLVNSHGPCYPLGQQLNFGVNNSFGILQSKNPYEKLTTEQNDLNNSFALEKSDKDIKTFLPPKDKNQERAQHSLAQQERLNKSHNLLKKNVGTRFSPLKRNDVFQKSINIQEYKITGVRVYIAERKRLQVGDKMSGRHGNKGIVSTILPREDMPYLPDGTPVDMVLNPLGIPSRMNVGQVFECLLGLAASVCGESIGHTPFDEMYGPEASRSLVYLFLYVSRLRSHADWIFQPNFPGKTLLFDGRTGTPFEQWVTVGRAYMLKLIHMVDEKIHARSIGPRSLVTQQPVKGRARGGGQRLGEMEVWALEGFGAAYTLQEILTIKSDDIKGREDVESSIISATSLSAHIPETFRITLFELRCLCLNLELNQNF